ncbi:MAG: hypothetical protein ACI9PP_002101, partial [Halobacteriales archaeon]
SQNADSAFHFHNLTLVNEHGGYLFQSGIIVKESKYNG